MVAVDIFTLLFNIKYSSLIKRTVLLTRLTALKPTFKLQYWSSVKEFLQVEEEAVALVNVPNGAFLIKRLVLIAQDQQKSFLMSFDVCKGMEYREFDIYFMLHK